MIANSNPNMTAGMLRAEIDYWRDSDAPAEFLVLIDPRDNPLLTLLQIAKLLAAGAIEPGSDYTFGTVEDTSTRYMAFTYSGSRDSFWHGLTLVTEQVIMEAEELIDERSPNQRSFARMLMSYGLPPLEVLPPVAMNDGHVLVDAEWDELA